MEIFFSWEFKVKEIFYVKEHVPAEVVQKMETEAHLSCKAVIQRSLLPELLLT